MRKPDSVALRTQAEVEQAKAQVATQDAAQITQAVETSALEVRQSLKNEQRSEASANELAAVMEAKAAQAAADAKLQRRAFDEAQARAAALASEPAGTGPEIETAQSQKAADEATKQKQAGDSTIAQLQPSLQQDQKKTTALMQEVKAAQATAADAKPQGRALDEAQARDAALASEPTGIGPEIETQTAQSQKAVDAATKQEQAADSPEPPEAAEAQGNAEAAKLIARASALLGRGDIGAARIVLERASETGSAKASFMLAETYDPTILTGWGTYGTRGEVTKARELYAKADAGGIQEAKNRLNALRQ